MVERQLAVDLLQGADGLEPLQPGTVAAQLRHQRIQGQRSPTQRPIDAFDPLGNELLRRLAGALDDTELGGHVGVEFTDAPPHLRCVGVVGPDRTGVDGAHRVHGLAPGGFGIDIDVGQQRHRRLHLLDLEHVVPAARAPTDDLGHAARPRLGEQNRDRQRRRHSVLEHAEERELHRLVFVVDDDGRLVLAGVRDLDRADLDGHDVLRPHREVTDRRLRRDRLGGGVRRSIRRGGFPVRGHRERHRRTVPGLGLLLAVAQGLGGQLPAVEDLALRDRVGHEVDEDGIGCAVVDVDGAEREVVDAADEGVAQVHVLGTAQGQGDVEATQGGAVADGDDGHEARKATELLGGVSERAGHRHGGDVGVGPEICCELGEPRLSGYPAG